MTTQEIRDLGKTAGAFLVDHFQAEFGRLPSEVKSVRFFGRMTGDWQYLTIIAGDLANDNAKADDATNWRQWSDDQITDYICEALNAARRVAYSRHWSSPAFTS